MDSQEKWTLAIALGIITTVLVCAVAFYGTIAFVVVHFIKKFW